MSSSSGNHLQNNTAAMKAESSSASSATKFAFRPSKLTSVTEKIWKKDAPACGSSNSAERVLNLVEKPVFSPSKTTAACGNAAASCTAAKPFIFGQNIKDRVVIKEGSQEETTNSLTNKQGVSNSNEVKKNREDVQKENQSTSLSSTSAATTGELVDFKHFNQNSDHKAEYPIPSTLEESARTYEQSKSQTNQVKLAENVEIKTGEEDEVNILHIVCKLHVFDHDKKTWEERGAAMFRLNECTANGPNETHDSAMDSAYRIVVRLNGNRKVVINSRLFGEMLVERLSPKRLKLSALDFSDSQNTTKVVLYLLTANQNDIDRVEKIVRFKLADLKSFGDTDSSCSKSKRKEKDNDEQHQQAREEKKLKTN